MKPNNYILAYAMFAAAIFATAPSAPAQKINGTPGSPESTTTVDGSYLPAPPPKFGGADQHGRQEFQGCAPPGGGPSRMSSCASAGGRRDCARASGAWASTTAASWRMTGC